MKLSIPSPNPRGLQARQAGLSLVELMVALAIMLFLLVGLVGVFANSNRSHIELSRLNQQIENGRFALQLLTDDVSLSGYYGRYYSGSLGVPASMPDPCETSDMAALRTAAALPVQGYDAPSSPPSPVSGCISSANHRSGTDILVIRRADTATTATGSLSAQEVYLQANADPNNSANPVIALGTAANFPLLNRDSTTLAPIRKYHVHIYFIAPCSIPSGGGEVCTGSSDDRGSPVPTLKRLELSVDPADGTRKMRIVSLVEGIENFQVDYGLDADGDGVPDGGFTTAPSSVAEWQNVVAINLNVLARNVESNPGYTDTKSYAMGVAGSVTPGGSYKRHVYNASLRIVNPSSRREIP